MKKDFWFIVISVLGLMASYYLLNHDINIEYGARGDSLCNINETIDCDQVSLSKYSKVFNIPVASLGAGFYIVVILLTLIQIFSGDAVKQFALSFRFILLAFSVITSIFLGYVSIFKVEAICIFCFFTYLCNIALFIIALIGIKKVGMKKLFSDLFLVLSKKIEIKQRLVIVFILFNLLLIMLSNIFFSDFLRNLYASDKKEKASSNYKMVDNITVITANEAYNNFFGKKNVVFIDNRPSSKFKSGHVKGAINLTYESPSGYNVMTKDILLKVAKDKTIVFYCTGFNRAYYASKVAIESWDFDRNKIFWLKEGFFKWNMENYPIESN
jgi:uncharacterized membrane protein/rhodanese-related sulfurtransferase